MTTVAFLVFWDSSMAKPCENRNNIVDLLTFDVYVLPLPTMFSLAAQITLRLRRRSQIIGLVNGVV
jgi:hypothetical protein